MLLLYSHFSKKYLQFANFYRKFSKEAACSKKNESSALETKLKILESKTRDRDDPEHVHCRKELDKLYKAKINGPIIRSRCDWHEHGEKSSKFFLNLEKNECCSILNKNHLMQ